MWSFEATVASVKVNEAHPDAVQVRLKVEGEDRVRVFSGDDPLAAHSGAYLEAIDVGGVEFGAVLAGVSSRSGAAVLTFDVPGNGKAQALGLGMFTGETFPVAIGGAVTAA